MVATPIEPCMKEKPMSTLAEKVCIITGATAGIGEATARALAEAGAIVVIAGRRSDRLEALVREIEHSGGRVTAVTCDVVDRNQVKALIAATVTAHGRIDVLINNAGIMPLATMSKCRMDDWDAMIDVNVKGLLYGVGYALPIMLEQKTGHIINVSSIAGRRVFSSGVVYCGTKHAVHAISEGLRAELAEQAKEDGNSIRVTVIAPGMVRTELPESIRDEETHDAFRKYADDFAGPLMSEDIAASIVYAMQAPEHVNVNEILIRPVSQLK